MSYRRPAQWREILAAIAVVVVAFLLLVGGSVYLDTHRHELNRERIEYNIERIRELERKVGELEDEGA